MPNVLITGCSSGIGRALADAFKSAGFNVWASARRPEDVISVPQRPKYGRTRTMAYQSIEVRKLTPSIGAEIFGVDLGKPLGNQQFQEVHDALMENLVIFFRDQKMTIDQHKDFGRRFGPLHTHPNAPIEFKEHPEILVIKADEGLYLAKHSGRNCVAQVSDDT